MSLTLIVCGKSVELESWTFPGGERNVRINDTTWPTEVRGVASITCIYRCSDDLVDLVLLVNAVRHTWPGIIIDLDIPYFPFARQDRVMTPGEANALQAIAQVINMLDFRYVLCLDPHSDVLAALFPAGKLICNQQWEAWQTLGTLVAENTSAALVSPDAGAAKKIYKLAAKLGWPVVEASKRRDPATGNILATTIDNTVQLNDYDTIFVVDDICDGGRTFIELAKALRDSGYTGKLHLCVSHGIFSKGIEVVNEHFDSIQVINDLRKD